MSINNFPIIREFITDPLYLGNVLCNKETHRPWLESFWVDELEKFYKDGNDTCCVHGSFFGGQYLAHNVCMIYDFCKLQAMDNPREYLQVCGDITFVVASTHKHLADQVIDNIMRIISLMPFVSALLHKNEYKDYIKFKSTTFGQIKRLIGTNVAGILLRYLDDCDNADAVIKDCYNIANRRQKLLGKAGHLLIASQWQYEPSAVTDSYYKIWAPIWKVKPQNFYKLIPKTFNITLDDGLNIEVPTELKEEKEQSLRELAGIFAGKD